MGCGYTIDPFGRWEDLRFPATAVNPPGLGSDPTLDTSTGTYLFGAAATDLLYFVGQMPHAWKEGSTIHPHIHWCPTSTDTGDVLWRFSYDWANIGGTFAGSYTDLDITQAGGGTDWGHQLIEWASIAGTGKTISSMLMMKVSRIGGDELDTYTGDARFLEFDIHYEVDSSGSRQETVK